MNNFNLHIEYVKNIRSIDLENILTGFRLLQEEALAKKTGCSKRKFTDSIIIDKVEKGSILLDISLNFDITIDVVQLLLLGAGVVKYITKKNNDNNSNNFICDVVKEFVLPKVITVTGNAIAKIISAIKHDVVLTLKDNHGNEIKMYESENKTINIKYNKDGSISQLIYVDQERNANKQG